MNSQKRPKAHHVLPQFYLRAWANDHGGVAALLRDGKEFETGPEALAVEKDFYTFERPDGVKDASVEKALAEIDGDGAAAHAALLRREFPLEPEQKLAFATWLGLQWLRGRSSRAGSEELADKLQKMLIRMGLENAEAEAGEVPTDESGPVGPSVRDELGGSAGPGIAIPDLGGLSEEERDEIKRDLDGIQFEVPRGVQLLHMLNTMGPAAMPFLEAEWHLLQFSEPILFTSDEPIILYRRPRPENQFLGVGPATSDRIYVPLSPRICLALIRAGSIGRQALHNLAPDDAHKINSESVRTWWSQLFRHVKGPPFPERVPPLPDERIVVS